MLYLPFELGLSCDACGCNRPQYHGIFLGSVGPHRAAYLLLAAARAPKWDIKPNLKQKKTHVIYIHFCTRCDINFQCRTLFLSKDIVYVIREFLHGD